MAKLVTTTGEAKTVYIGFSESEEAGSLGQFHAMQEAAEKSGMSWTALFAKTTSIVTDGESANTGQHHSLWVHLSEERKKSAVSTMPLLKIWCAVHRAQLAYKDMANSVPEIPHIISDCKSVATFYGASAVRMKGIKESAANIGVLICQFPTGKDFRFTEY